MKIGHTSIGRGNPCFIIAEVGVNHNGSEKTALELIAAAAQAGVDAVKFQHFYPEELVTADTPQAVYQKNQAPGFSGQAEMLRSLALSIETHARLKIYCEKLGLAYLCTPYDSRSLKELAQMGVHGLKIASTDATNVPFLREIDGLGIPSILSTGMCVMDEVGLSVQCLDSLRCQDALMLLQCTAEYPAPAEDSNLKVMQTLAKEFGLPVGFSDHTQGIHVAGWAVAAGACVLEKHFTLSRELPGPDHASSVEPAELKALVCLVRQVETAMGDGEKRIMPSEARNKPLMQKHVVTRLDVARGETLTESNLTTKRSPQGVPASQWDTILGKTAGTFLKAGSVIQVGDLAS